MDLTFYVALIAVVLVIGGYITFVYKNGEKEKLYTMIKELVDEAEKRYGSGAGEIKYNHVVARIYKMIPKPMKFFISEELIDLWIERAVDELQEQLDELISQEGKE